MPKFTYHHVFEPAADGDAPPLLLLHGTGGSETDLLRLGRMLSPGSALLSPRGDVSEAGALRFFPRLAEGVFDPEEVAKRTNALADFVSSATKHYRIDGSKLVAVGFSNGANIAASMLLLRPDTLAAAALFRPMVVIDLPAAANSLIGKRVLIANGSTDPLVPPDHPERLAELFRAGGAEVVVRTHAASHALVQADVDATRTWLEAERTRVSASR
jgi:phospholipase/carboxylesterase